MYDNVVSDTEYEKTVEVGMLVQLLADEPEIEIILVVVDFLCLTCIDVIQNYPSDSILQGTPLNRKNSNTR